MKNYEDFLNEEINWKKTLGTAALGVGLSLSNPSFAGDNYTKDRTESPSDTIRTTGIEEPENYITCDVFPNPCTEVLNYRIDSKESVISLYIFSINGDLIKQIKPDDFEFDSNSINVSSLSAGIYLFVVETENGKKSIKFIKR